MKEPDRALEAPRTHMGVLSERAWRGVVVAALAVLATASIQIPIHTGVARACVLDVITLKTIRVDVKSAMKEFRVGDVAEFKLAATRPAREDAAGLGVPTALPVSAPAEGLNTGIVVTMGDEEFLYGFGKPTDARGESTAKIEISPSIPLGKPADLAAFAWKTQVQGPCFVVVEHGSVVVAKAFEIKK